MSATVIAAFEIKIGQSHFRPTVRSWTGKSTSEQSQPLRGTGDSKVCVHPGEAL